MVTTVETPPTVRDDGHAVIAPTQRFWARRPDVDEVAVLSVWLVLLFGLPERLVVPAVGAAGAPAALLSLALLGWWLLARLVPSLTAGGGSQPIRQALVVFGWITLLVYMVALLRGLPPVQQRAADRYLLTMAGVAGVALVIADGVRSRARLDTLLNRVTLGGAALAIMGLVHNFIGFAYSTWVHVPGLALNQELFQGVQRGQLERISGTANHPIGYGVGLALILPLAIHYALSAEPGRDRQWRVAIAVTVAAGIPLAISRSAVISVAIGLAALFVGWSWRRRINALGVLGVTLVAYQVLLPGRLVTLVNLFRNADADNSVTARTRDYAAVFDYISDHPWFGLGPGTFLPDEYLQLDNQALKLMLEGGLVGVLAIVLLYTTGVRLARAARRASTDPETRQLGQCLIGIIAAAAVVLITFDAFSYGFYLAVLSVALGAAGALWRLTIPEAT
jgi:O-antigen ligase